MILNIFKIKFIQISIAKHIVLDQLTSMQENENYLKNKNSENHGIKVKSKIYYNEKKYSKIEKNFFNNNEYIIKTRNLKPKNQELIKDTICNLDDEVKNKKYDFSNETENIIERKRDFSYDNNYTKETFEKSNYYHNNHQYNYQNSFFFANNFKQTNKNNKNNLYDFSKMNINRKRIYTPNNYSFHIKEDINIKQKIKKNFFIKQEESKENKQLKIDINNSNKYYKRSNTKDFKFEENKPINKLNEKNYYLKTKEYEINFLNLNGEKQNNIFEKKIIYNRNKNNFYTEKTHFINIPILDEIFIEEYIKLCEFIKSKNLKDFQHELLQKPGKLHFTICVLNLGDDREKIDKVHKIMQSLNADFQILTNNNLKYNFDGFSSMSETKECRVVYSKLKVDENYRILSNIINLIIKKFVEEGIIIKKDLNKNHINYDKKNDFYSIKIHMTLLNVLFLNKILKKKKMKFIRSIDSEKILEFLNGQIIFPSASITEIHFSRMRENKITEKYEMLYSYNI